MSSKAECPPVNSWVTERTDRGLEHGKGYKSIMPQLLVNKFIVLTVEEYKDSYSNLSDTSVYLTTNYWTSTSYCPR